MQKTKPHLIVLSDPNGAGKTTIAPTLLQGALKVRESVIANKKKLINALKKGIRDALLKHKLLGKPVAIGKNGKAVWVPAKKIRIKNN